MELETAFAVLNGVAMLGWIGMFIAPRSALTHWLVHRAVLPVLLAIVYAVLVLTGGPGEGSFMTLAGVMQLFSSPQVLLAGWVHYLVFDMLVGAWELRRAQELNIPHLVVLPFLGLTLMLGPFGYLLFRGLESAWMRKQNNGR